MYEAWKEIHRLFLTEHPAPKNNYSTYKIIDFVGSNIQDTLKKLNSVLDSPILDTPSLVENFNQLIFNLRCIQQLEPSGISTLFKLIKAHYLFGLFYKKVGQALSAETQFCQADHLCKDLLQLSNDHIDTLRLQVNIQYELQNYDRSITILQNILSLSGRSQRDFFLMGFLLNIEEKSDLNALDFLKDSNNLSKDVLLQKAIAYRKQDNYQEAEYYLKNALTLDSEFAQAYEEFAYLKIKQNDIFATLSLAKEALDLDPQLLHAVNILSDAYEHLGDYDKALNTLKKSPQNTHPFVLSHLANLYYDMQRFSEAFETSKAIPNNPPNPKIVAAYHLQQGNFPLALETLETNSENDEDDQEICALKLSIALQMNHPQKITDYSDTLSRLLSLETKEQDYEEASAYLDLVTNTENEMLANYGRAMVLFTQTCLSDFSSLILFYNSQIFLHLAPNENEVIENSITAASVLIEAVLLIFRKLLIIYFNTENYALAINYFSLISKLDVLTEQETTQFIQCQRKIPHHKEAIPYHAQEIFKQLVFFYELKTFYYFSRDMIELAFTAAKKAFHLDKQSHALNFLGAWHKEQQGNYTGALQDLSVILDHHFKYQMLALANITSNPKEMHNPILACIFAIQARCYYKTNQVSKAFKITEQGWGFDSSSQDIKLLLAYHHLENKNFAKALALVTEILTLDPDEMTALNIRALASLTNEMPFSFSDIEVNSLFLRNYANQLHLAIKDQLRALQLTKTFSPLSLQELARLYLLTEQNEALEEILSDQSSVTTTVLHQCSMSFFTQKVAKSFLSPSTNLEVPENSPKVRDDLTSAKSFISALPIDLLGRKRKARELTQLFEERASKKATIQEETICTTTQALMN